MFTVVISVQIHGKQCTKMAYISHSVRVNGETYCLNVPLKLLKLNIE